MKNCFTDIKSRDVTPQEMKNKTKKLPFEIEYCNSSYVAGQLENKRLWESSLLHQTSSWPADVWLEVME